MGYWGRRVQICGKKWLSDLLGRQQPQKPFQERESHTIGTNSQFALPDFYLQHNLMAKLFGLWCERPPVWVQLLWKCWSFLLLTTSQSTCMLNFIIGSRQVLRGHFPLVDAKDARLFTGIQERGTNLLAFEFLPHVSYAVYAILVWSRPYNSAILCLDGWNAKPDSNEVSLIKPFEFLMLP